MARKRTKGGDSLPVDFFGNLLGVGSLVLVPAPQKELIAEAANDVPRQLFGYVAKMGKSYLDAKLFPTNGEKPFKLRVRDVKNTVIEINPRNVPSNIPEWEAIKLEAAEARE